MSKVSDLLAAHEADQLCAEHGIGAFLFEMFLGRIDAAAVVRGHALIGAAIVKVGREMRGQQ